MEKQKWHVKKAHLVLYVCQAEHHTLLNAILSGAEIKQNMLDLIVHDAITTYSDVNTTYSDVLSSVCAEMNVNGRLELFSYIISRALATFMHHVPQHSAIPLCDFMLSSALWLSCS